MKKQLIGLGVAVVMFGGVGNADATMMQTTWTAQITSYANLDSDLFTVGETITIKSIFDDAHHQYQTFQDGGDFTARTSDDVGESPITLANEVYMDNVEYIFEHNVNTMISRYTNIYYDSRNHVIEYQLATPTSYTQYFHYRADAIDIHMMSRDYDTQTSGTADWGYIYVQTGSAAGAGIVNYTNIQSSIEALDPVPEPATMLIFGTGLVGLVGFRIRKKKLQERNN